MPEQRQPQDYPIQPTFIVVKEIHFASRRPPRKTDKIDESQIKFSQSLSPFDEVQKRIQVTLSAEFGFDTSATNPPFSVKVVMIGEFAISDEFPRDKIQLWANVNAPFVIYPYLRERLYYITSQGGFPPIMLPLLQIPTIKLEKPQPAPEMAQK
jgi:preprotein translocase subunit SecB